MSAFWDDLQANMLDAEFRDAYEAVAAKIATLDGTDLAAVALITGYSTEEIAALGGIKRDAE